MPNSDSPTQRKEFCLYVITKDGLGHAAVLKSYLKDRVDVFVSEKFVSQFEFDCIPLKLPFKEKIGQLFNLYNGHIFIISVGAVVRMIAPFIKNKKTDPAVICIDDMANFTICLLSGHVGRGNQYTKEISDQLESTAVITTASDAKGTLPVDILGRDQGFQLEDLDKNITRGAAAVVNDESILLVQETGEPDFWPMDKILPKNITYATSLSDFDTKPFSFILYITDKRVRKIPNDVYQKSIIYRPKSLIVGIGCDKNTSLETLETGVNEFFEEFGLSTKAIKSFATIDIKLSEPGLQELAKKWQIPLIAYTAKELDSIENGIENPSETVKKFIGTKTVAEGASLLAAKTNKLLVPKQKFKNPKENKNMTLAISRIEFSIRKEASK